MHGLTQQNRIRKDDHLESLNQIFVSLRRRWVLRENSISNPSLLCLSFAFEAPPFSKGLSRMCWLVNRATTDLTVTDNCEKFHPPSLFSSTIVDSYKSTSRHPCSNQRRSSFSSQIFKLIYYCNDTVTVSVNMTKFLFFSKLPSSALWEKWIIKKSKTNSGSILKYFSLFFSWGTYSIFT